MQDIVHCQFEQRPDGCSVHCSGGGGGLRVSCESARAYSDSHGRGFHDLPGAGRMHFDGFVTIDGSRNGSAYGGGYRGGHLSSNYPGGREGSSSSYGYSDGDNYGYGNGYVATEQEILRDIQYVKEIAQILNQSQAANEAVLAELTEKLKYLADPELEGKVLNQITQGDWEQAKALVLGKSIDEAQNTHKLSEENKNTVRSRIAKRRDARHHPSAPEPKPINPQLDIPSRYPVPKSSSTAEILARMAQAKSVGTEPSIFDNKTLFEKAILIGLIAGGSALVLPESILAAFATIVTAFTIGPVTEGVLLDTLANPVFLQAASRLGILFGDAAAAIKSGFFESKTAQVIKGFPENTIFHSVNTTEKATGVLGGINVEVFSVDSRFGRALYTSVNPETTLAELAYRTQTAKYTIRYKVNLEHARILDLADASIAKEWGYVGGNSYDVSQIIAKKAQDAGYNIIRFNSERGQGINLAILDDFDVLLEPKMIVPSPAPEISNIVNLEPIIEDKVANENIARRP